MVEIFQAPTKKVAAGAPVTKRVAASPEPAPAPRASLYCATPAYGCIMNNQFLTSMIRLHQMAKQAGVVVYFDCLGNESLITRARNILTERFLRSPATHLIFIDADIGFDPASVFRLLAADKDCACGCYAKKNLQFDLVKKKTAEGSEEPIHQQGLDFNLNIQGNRAEAVDGFVKVLDSATGFMLIKRQVFTTLIDKLPQTIKLATCDTPGLGIKTYRVFFDCIVDPDSKRYLSEDFTFCRWMQQAGLDVWADLSAPMLHVGSYCYEGDPAKRLIIINNRPERQAAGTSPSE